MQKQKKYQSYTAKVYFLEGCIVWGSRVVITPPGRVLVLEELYDCRLGASIMKSFAREYGW